jgi:thiamine biosynthesis lipoprotein
MRTAVAPGAVRRAFSFRCVLACAAALVAVACARGAAPLKRVEYALGTMCSITLYDHATKPALDEAFARLHGIDARMSVNTAGSELDAVNDAAGRSPVSVTEDVFAVVQRALQLSDISGGRFDPTVGPLVKLWGINTEKARVPPRDGIAAALKLIDWHDVVMDAAARSIFLKRPGMSLDVGGVAKGYAADEVVRILSSHGVEAAIVDLGGNIYAMGSKPGGSPWRIGVQNPDAPRGDPLGIVAVTSTAVVTSGVYERYFMEAGKRYHHIMDTRNGFPVDNGLASVTVVSPRAFDADGVTLALFSLGPQKGLALARRLGVEAIWVTDDHLLYATKGARAMLTVTDPLFTFPPPPE